MPGTHCSKSFLGLISFNSPITLSLNDEETETQEIWYFAEGHVARKEWSWNLNLAVWTQSSPSEGLAVPLCSYRSSGNSFTSLKNKHVSFCFAILGFQSLDMASLECYLLPKWGGTYRCSIWLQLGSFGECFLARGILDLFRLNWAPGLILNNSNWLRPQTQGQSLLDSTENLLGGEEKFQETSSCYRHVTDNSSLASSLWWILIQRTKEFAEILQSTAILS